MSGENGFSTIRTFLGARASTTLASWPSPGQRSFAQKAVAIRPSRPAGKSASRCRTRSWPGASSATLISSGVFWLEGESIGSGLLDGVEGLEPPARSIARRTVMARAVSVPLLRIRTRQGWRTLASSRPPSGLLSSIWIWLAGALPRRDHPKVAPGKLADRVRRAPEAVVQTEAGASDTIHTFLLDISLWRSKAPARSKAGSSRVPRLVCCSPESSSWAAAGSVPSGEPWPVSAPSPKGNIRTLEPAGKD